MTENKLPEHRNRIEWNTILSFSNLVVLTATLAVLFGGALIGTLHWFPGHPGSTSIAIGRCYGGAAFMAGLWGVYGIHRLRARR